MSRQCATFVGLVSALLPAALLGGCMVPINPELPAQTRLATEPVTGGEYYVYVPSTYDAKKSWPLVVTCHGTPPWDVAKFQVDEWSPLAEDKGFIVIAPKLSGTHGDFPPPLDKQIQRQREDEKLILAAVRHVRGAYNVAADQIFITGWSAGGYAVLFTGLRNPDVFRAAAMRQCNFDERYVALCKPFLDRYQPIYVLYGSLDAISTGESKEALAWLRGNGQFVREHEIYGSHRRHPKLAFEFFKKCVKQYPWLRIEAHRRLDDPPLAVRLQATGSPVPTGFAWSFGDDSAVSHDATPYHVYAQAGTYRIKLAARVGKRDPVRRQIELVMPRPSFGLPTEKVDP